MSIELLEIGCNYMNDFWINLFSISYKDDCRSFLYLYVDKHQLEFQLFWINKTCVIEL